MILRLRSLLPLFVISLVAAILACGSDRLRRANEAIEVVPGNPSVSTGLPGVDRGDGGPDGSVYGPAAPFQIDSFQQQAVQKVDILWVIDDSPSMTPKQNLVKQNFHSFIQFLKKQAVDYHLGVTTTDTYDPAESGRLVNYAGLPQPWIDSTTQDPEAAFVMNASVGVRGSGDEKALLGGLLALTAPLSPSVPASPDADAANCAKGPDGGPECFLRPEAPLYTVIISDEEDSSCAPIIPSGPSATEGCLEGDIRSTSGGFGSIDYWSRFYSGVKGAGGISRVAAITAIETDPHNCADVFPNFCDQDIQGGICSGAPDCSSNPNSSCCQAIFNTCSRRLFEVDQFCKLSAVSSGGTLVAPYYQVNGTWNGCVASHLDPGTQKTVVDFTAFTGTRYATVAQNTGGVATSICSQDYTPALEKLGLQASGLRTDFPLSRAPNGTSITVLEDNLAVAEGPSSWQYVGCEIPAPTGPLPHAPVNAIRFTSPPDPDTTIAVSYDVNVRGLPPCP